MRASMPMELQRLGKVEWASIKLLLLLEVIGLTSFVIMMAVWLLAENLYYFMHFK